MAELKASQVVIELANIASKGKYEVTPQGARHMNQIFELVAKLINDLEADEKEQEVEDGLTEEGS